MGKKSGPSAPAAPDPAKTAAAQAAANKEAVQESARVNAVDQYSPYGSVVYNRDDTGLPTSVTTSLSAEQQQQLDAQNALANVLLGAAQNQAQFLPTERFSLDGLPPSPSNTDFGAQRDQVTQATYDRAKALLDPDFEQQERQLTQTLADRGIPLVGRGGSEAADREFDNFDRRKGATLEQLALSSVLAGGQEQDRLINQARTARSDATNDRLLERTQPYNELAAFLQGSPALQNPTTQSTANYQIAAPDIAGLTQANYAAQVNAANQAAANRQSSLNGMYGLAGSIGSAAIPLLFSDVRLKTDIHPIGRLKGLTWYAFRYIWGPAIHFGVMAQEVMKVKPDAVHNVAGFLAVDYSKILEA